jgi:hypothetical protein
MATEHNTNSSVKKKPETVTIDFMAMRIFCREVSLKQRYAYSYVFVKATSSVGLSRKSPYVKSLSSRRQVAWYVGFIIQSFGHRNIRLKRDQKLSSFVGGAVFLCENEIVLLTRQQFRAAKTKLKILAPDKQVTVLY